MRIILFEPWSLGDVAIAASITKIVCYSDIQVGIVASSRYFKWLEAIGLFHSVFQFDAPWVQWSGKYWPWKYSLREILRLREQVKGFNPDIICSPREDMRHRFFLEILRVHPARAVLIHAHRNVYAKIGAVASLLGVEPKSQPVRNLSKLKNGNASVYCFFSSGRPNRSVPFDIGVRIIKGLIETGSSVSLVLPPEERIDTWRSVFSARVGESFSIVQGPLEVISTEFSQKACLCLTTDSAWMHLAYLYGVPIVGMFGFDTYEEWAPPGCVPVFSRKILPSQLRYSASFQHVQPLAELEPEEVVNVCNRLLREGF
jgi:ADP-heptose:LPS heptosyltransferase